MKVSTRLLLEYAYASERYIFKHTLCGNTSIKGMFDTKMLVLNQEIGDNNV